MSEGKEWTALISFLIEVSLASDKRNSRILFKCNTLLSDITEPDDETIPYEEKFENLAKRIVNDYSIVQITHNSDYILGLSGIDKVPVVFPTKENVDSLVKIVKEVLSDKFNNDFISNFQEKEKSFLFRVNFSSVFPTHLWNVCEIDSGSVTESNEDKSNDTEDEIRFVVKVIPSKLKWKEKYVQCYDRLPCVFSDRDNTTVLITFILSASFGVSSYIVDDFIRLRKMQGNDYVIGGNYKFFSSYNERKSFIDIIEKAIQDFF